MLCLKYLLMWSGIGMISIAAGILAHDIYRETKYRQALATPGAGPLPRLPQTRWRSSLALALLAWGPIVLALGIVVVPSGMAGVRVSKTSGTLPGALYPGAHLLVPLAENIVLFDTRDQMRALQANSEADAMQYTLQLKQKQIEQSKLEAEVRKQTTVKNAEAQAEAKVIDSKAEMERRKLLANKIVSERLADKPQIMMVPADGKVFFANDVLRSMSVADQASQAEEPDEQQPR
jgi:regulator of protease activity HflC (stomatin/prohibitin superfamily)